MQKFAAIALLGLLLLSLCACTPDPATTGATLAPATQGTTVATQPTTAPTEPVTEPPVTEPPATACSHDYQIVDSLEATCTEFGQLTYACSLCGHSFMVDQPLAAHIYEEATCTTPKTCKVCDITEGDAMGHDWTQATCTKPKTCKVCDITEGDATGHDWAQATCTKPKTCKVCGITEGDAMGHDWAQATCTKPKTCKVCGITEGNTIAHVYADGVCSYCNAKDPNRPILPKFQDLVKANPDVVGYIYIEGIVNYPILHRPQDKNYYIDRNFYGNYDKRGCIYLREACDINEPTDVLTIYGHAMADGQMFGMLNRYLYKSFFNSHQTFTIWDLYSEHTYQVVCVFKTSGTYGVGFPFHLFDDFANEAEYEEFINGVRDLAIHDSGVETQYGDQFVCLCTCEYTLTNGRLIVVAKRIS